WRARRRSVFGPGARPGRRSATTVVVAAPSVGAAPSSVPDGVAPGRRIGRRRRRRGRSPIRGSSAPADGAGASPPASAAGRGGPGARGRPGAGGGPVPGGPAPPSAPAARRAHDPVAAWDAFGDRGGRARLRRATRLGRGGWGSVGRCVAGGRVCGQGRCLQD